jgi:hypothetical protein
MFLGSKAGPVRKADTFTAIIIFIIVIIITGTTALCEPWPSSGFLYNLIFRV